MGLLFWEGLKKTSMVGLLDKILLGKNENGKTAYADINQLRQMMGVFASGAIVPTLVPSTTLGSPTEAKIFYAGAGTYSTPAGSLTLTANFNLLFWDLVSWSFLAVPITFEQSRLEALENTVGSLVFKNYPVDFAGLNTKSGGGEFFGNRMPTTKSGVLGSVRIKEAAGQFVEIKAFTIDFGTNAVTILHNYGEFELKNESSNIQIVSIADNYVLPVGSYVGVRNTAGTGLYYATSTANSGFQISNTTLLTFNNNNKFAVDFTIIETESLNNLSFAMFDNGRADTKRDSRISSIESKNLLLQSQLINISQNVQVIDTRSVNNATEIGQIEGRIDDLESFEANANAQINTLIDAKNNHGNRLGTLELAKDNVQLQINFERGRINTLNTNQAAFVTEQQTQNTDITNLQTAISFVGDYDYDLIPQGATLSRGFPGFTYFNKTVLNPQGYLKSVKLRGIVGEKVRIQVYEKNTKNNTWGLAFESVDFFLESTVQEFDFTNQSVYLNENMVVGYRSDMGVQLYVSGVGQTVFLAGGEQPEAKKLALEFKIEGTNNQNGLSWKVFDLQKKLQKNNIF
jgi:hypothetical protein